LHGVEHFDDGPALSAFIRAIFEATGISALLI
jgi:hypothetical protein